MTPEELKELLAFADTLDEVSIRIGDIADKRATLVRKAVRYIKRQDNAIDTRQLADDIQREYKAEAEAEIERKKCQ